MLELEAAIERILAAMPPPQAERIPLASAHGRVLAERLVSAVDLPPFDNSAVDGFAVRAADVSKAVPSSPASLCQIGRVAAGQSFFGKLNGGGCVRIFTGSPLPQGADAVVMQEDAQPDPSWPGTVLILDAVKPWENVRFRGGDLKQGATLGEPGDELTAARLQLLAATGLAEVTVGRRPTCSLLATGSELVDPGQPLSSGKIYESNRLALAALVNRSGGTTRVFSLVPDNLEDTCAALEAAFHEADLVITSGGVSVGEADFVKSAFEQLGGELQFWKVAIRPGRPFVFGRLQNKFLFGLPGNPVSAFVTFLLLVRPALLRWQGAREVNLPAQPATLAEPLSNPGNRRHFLRVILDANGTVRPAGVQLSHALASLAAANGLVDLPPATTLPANASVKVLRWE